MPSCLRESKGREIIIITCIPSTRNSPGSKISPLDFAILVNRLATTWPCRLKHADDTTVVDAIARCSLSYLPLIVTIFLAFPPSEECALTLRNVRLWILISSNTSLVPWPLLRSPCPSGADVQAPWSPCFYDLSWNTHVDHIVTKASKRFYARPLLRKSAVAFVNLVSIYFAFIRSILE